MNSAERTTLAGQIAQFKVQAQKYKTDGNMQAQIILGKIILAGESYLSRLKKQNQLAQLPEDTGANEVVAEDRRLDVSAQGVSATGVVGAPLSLRDQRLSADERRLALEEGKLAFEKHKHATEERRRAREERRRAREERRRAMETNRQAIDQAVDQASMMYDASLSEYRDFLNAADSVRDVPYVESGNIFCRLQVFDENVSESNHECQVAEYRYLFFRSNNLLPLAKKFQAICMRNTQVAACRIEDTAPVANRSEQAFTDQVVREMAPRLRVILEEVVGIRNVHIQTLHKNSGVDIGLTAFSSDGGKLLFYLPIEVKNVFGPEISPDQIPRNNLENFRRNQDQLRTLCYGGPRLKIEALWHAFTQTAHYMGNDMPQSNYGVVVAKNAMFLLWRVDSEKVLVSDGVSYTSTDPHPAAIIAFFVAFVLRHSTAVNIPGLNPELHLLESASRRQVASRSSHADRDGSQRQQQSTRGDSSRTRTGPIVSRRGIESLPALTGTLYGGRPAGNAADSIGGFSTAYESTEDVNSKLKEKINPLDFTKRPLDLALKDLRHFLTWRCSVFYGTWHDGQPIAVKAAPMDNEELFEEISNELAVYMRLKDLQGTNIPRLIEYGCAYIDGEKCAVLVIERINEPALMDESVMLDERPAFKQLSMLEKTACFNVLEKMHRCGIAHNDIRGANILF
ncbi:hypothetical protein GGH96_006340, partial [Coemansia sp. RSA 1972]